ncbi:MULTISPECIES: MFS transporter [Serratia]|jgi:ACS family tartrate transporter-like MFS transporter|uniref:MFS transporter n=2 Tax=Serratia fonticola TaxID=47917 RepID=A0ABY9PLK3_SERFO|nr:MULTISPECIES: MFS transporter [Serratia]MCO7507995.1 MFS transporter [Serratia fonticola]NBJ32466.1 MFS transporter [Serratia fonticola]NCG54684.1 MFS transporter [Serratia fonticola]WMT14090.1 MFS transporter [Serratia fonticola]CAI2031939.1 Inner membrane transport protein RhmT [Serratia fonticola]
MQKRTPQEIERSAIRKMTLNIVPLMILLYFLAFLDRNNMAYAAMALEDSLGLTATAFGFASGIFFIGYFMFEIPSNAGTIKFGPRIWFARILITWGIFAVLMGFVRTPMELYICRFMLGVCEAGFFPSVVYYFTVFFPEKYRTKILGMFIIVQPLSNAIGSPISGLILNVEHGWFGLEPWQWLFILEGVPPVIIGLFIPFIIKNSPKDVGYLDVEEKAWLMDNTTRSKSGSKVKLSDFVQGIKNKKYLLYAMLNFGMVCGIYGFGMWLPSIITAISGDDIFRVSLIAFIPYGLAALLVYPWSLWASKSKKIGVFAGISMIVAAFGLIGAVVFFNYNVFVALMFLSVAAIGIYTSVPSFLSMPANISTGAAAAAGLAVVSCIGNIGGFVAPYVVGLLKDVTNSNTPGLVFLSLCLLVTGLICIFYCAKQREGVIRS